MVNQPLGEGSYRHATCASCNETTIKNFLSPTTRWISRVRICDDQIVDFSILLQVLHGGVWRFVTRFSVAHASFHQYHWFRRLPPDAGQRRGGSLINNQQHLTQAFQQALELSYPETEHYLTRWETGP